MKKQNKILLSVIAVVLTGAIVLFSSNSDLFQGLSLKGKKPTIDKAIVVRDVCPNLKKSQSKVPTGFLKDKNGDCVLDYEVAGVLTVQTDPNQVAGSIPAGSRTEALSLDFSTSGELPITVTELNIIAVSGYRAIDYIQLYDLDNRNHLGERVYLDETGKARVSNGNGLFIVTRGSIKNIGFDIKTNEFAENNSQIQLGIYSDNFPDESGIDYLDFYSRSNDNKRDPFISYDDGGAQYSDGSHSNPYVSGRDVRLMFLDTMTVNNQNFHVIAGPIIRLTRN